MNQNEIIEFCLVLPNTYEDNTLINIRKGIRKNKEI